MASKRYLGLLVPFSLLIISSCAGGLPSSGIADLEDPSVIYPALPEGSVLTISGKVRIELPKYRIRGNCRIFSYPDGALEIDFLHSSLFGSYREEATVYSDSGSLIIHDRKRDVFTSSDSTLAMMREYLGFDIYPDDMRYILLLAQPGGEGSELEMHAGGGGKVTISGSWRERDIEITGSIDGGVTSFTCRDTLSGAAWICRYGYAEGSDYPERIIFEKEYGSGRVSLTVTGTGDEPLTDDGEE